MTSVLFSQVGLHPILLIGFHYSLVCVYMVTDLLQSVSLFTPLFIQDIPSSAKAGLHVVLYLH